MNLMLLKELIYDWNGINVKLFMLINNFFLDKNYLNGFLSLLSETANIRKTPIIILLSAIISLLLIYRMKIPFQKILSDPYSYRLFYCVSKISISLVFIFIIIYPLKNHFNFVRPICSFNHDKIHIIPELSFNSIAEMVEDKCDPKENSSFPSGHAAISIVLIGAFWHLFQPHLRIALLLYPLAIGISRVAIGVHYPADVLAGYIIGSICLIGASYCSVYFKRLLFRYFKFN